MQGPSWISLFERIPTTLHDTLAITLATGAEILMQSMLRLESDFAILRGRMSGSTDAGRVLIIPYDQIVNLAFTKRMLEPEVQAVFGKTLESPTALNGTAPAGAEAAVAAGPSPVEVPRPAGVAPTSVSRTTAPAAAAGTGQPPPPSKSILLARLRARLAEQGKS